MIMWLQFRIVQLISAYMTLRGLDHGIVQQKYAQRIVDELYLKSAQYLVLMDKAEYEEVEEFYVNLAAVIVASPTFYDSAKNALRFCNYHNDRLNEIFDMVKKDDEN